MGAGGDLVRVAELEAEGVAESLGGSAVAAAGVAHEDQHVLRRLPSAATTTIDGGDAGGEGQAATSCFREHGGEPFSGNPASRGGAVVEGAAEGRVQLASPAEHGVAYGAPVAGDRDHHGALARLGACMSSWWTTAVGEREQGRRWRGRWPCRGENPHLSAPELSGDVGHICFCPSLGRNVPCDIPFLMLFSAPD